jgi:hypothetical protein
MNAAVRRAARNARPDRPAEMTLLELVTAVGQTAGSDRETIAVVLELLRSRRVRLRGNFRGKFPESFE